MPAGNFAITTVGEHGEHPADEKDTIATFLKLHKLLASAYWQEHRDAAGVEIRRYLLDTKHVDPRFVPSAARINKWRTNHKQEIFLPPPTQPQEGSMALVQPMQHLLSEYVRDVEATENAGLPLMQLTSPANVQYAAVLTGKAFCIPFLCPGMYAEIKRYKGTRLHLVVDVYYDKWAVKGKLSGVIKKITKTAKHQKKADMRGVLTISMLTKGHLSLTDIVNRHLHYPITPGKRCRTQAKANATHAIELLHACVNGETTAVLTHTFEYFIHLWNTAHPDRPVPSVLRGVHKDCNTVIEAARRIAFRFARPIADFWHLLQNDATLTEKLENRDTLVNGKNTLSFKI